MTLCNLYNLFILNAMPSAPINPQLNLLPSDRFEYSKLGRFLKWALSAGRYLVVFTELIVIVAFISRFWFDRQLTDLREQRIQKSALVDSFKNIQNKFLATQAMFNLIQNTLGGGVKTVIRLNEIQSLTPLGIEYQSVIVSSQSASLVGFAPNTNSFSSLVTLFQSDPSKSFKSVDVKQFGLSKARSPGFDFTLELTP